MARSSSGIADGIGSAVSALGSIASSVGSSLGKSLSSGGTNSFSNLLSGSGQILSSMTSVFSNVAKSSGSILNNLISKYSSPSSNNSNSYKQMTNMATSTGGSILTSLASIFKPNSKSSFNISNAINALRDSVASRTQGSSFFKNLFSKSNGSNSKTVDKISPLNIFGGLKNLISGVRSGISNGAGTVTSLSTMGLLDLSTTLGSASQRIMDSFAHWKNSLQSIVGTGAMIGESLAYELAANQDSIEVLLDDFGYYATDLVYTLQDAVQEAEYADEYGYYDENGVYYEDPSMYYPEQGNEYYVNESGYAQVVDPNVVAYGTGDNVQIAAYSSPSNTQVQVVSTSYNADDLPEPIDAIMY